MKIQKIYLNNDGTITEQLKKNKRKVSIKKDSVVIQNNSQLLSEVALVKAEDVDILSVPEKLDELAEEKPSKKKKDKSSKKDSVDSKEELG